MADGEVIAKIFCKMDADNSGTICESELSSAFKDFDRDGKSRSLLFSIFGAAQCLV